MSGPASAGRGHGPNYLSAANFPNRRKWAEKTQRRRTRVHERRVRPCRVLFLGRSFCGDGNGGGQGHDASSWPVGFLDWTGPDRAQATR